MIRAYVAGPFRGPNHWVIAQNIRRAEELALDLWSLGLSAYCPHANTAHFQGALPDEVWLKGHLEWMGVADVVVVLSDSHDSSGTITEVETALANGAPIFLERQRSFISDARRITGCIVTGNVARFKTSSETLGEWVEERK